MELKTKIFVINGHNQVGKDTFVKMLQEIADNKNEKILNVSTIDYVKDIAKKCGWDGTKTDRNRRFLSDLKDLLTEWNDGPHKAIDEIIYHYNETMNAIFIHCREPEEIRRFVDDYAATTILVERNDAIQCSSNHADLGVNNYNYDIIINNSRGLKELKEEAEIFYDSFLSEKLDFKSNL